MPWGNRCARKQRTLFEFYLRARHRRIPKETVSPIYTRLGKYEIVKKLGRGGMADVYLALDTEKNRQVALKLIETSSNRDQDSLEAERRGAVLQSRLAGIDSRIAAV